MFFYGDKPAAQFERGTQQGGYYPCGTCGCDVRPFDDLAYCLNSKWRSMEDLQQIAIEGIFYIYTHCRYYGAHVGFATNLLELDGCSTQL